TADVQGFAFDRAVERLADLALVDEQRIDIVSTPRYILHPLVRAFAGARLVEKPEFETGAREQWVEWYLTFSQQMQLVNHYDDIKPEMPTLLAVGQWLMRCKRMTEAAWFLALNRHALFDLGYWPDLLVLAEAVVSWAEAAADADALAEALRSVTRITRHQGRWS